LNLEYFIAKRLSGTTSYKSSASSTIIKIAIVAIALGMVMMLIAISVTLGLQREIRQKISAFSGDMLVSNFDGNNSQETVNPVAIDQDFYPDFDAVPEVTHVQAITSRAGIIRTENTFEGTVVKGLGDDYDWSRIEDYIVEGRKPDFTKEIVNTETLFSTYLANRLNLKIGDKVVIYFVNKETQKFRPLRLDIVIFIDDFDEIERVNNEVYQNSGSTLRSISVLQRNSQIFDWIQLFDFNMILIIVVMILVAGINMIVALLVLVLERTQMIGILKALGCSDWSIRKVFLYNAMYLIGLGLFWGNIIGLGLLFIQKYFGIITLDPTTYYVKQAPVVIEFGYVFALNLGVFIVCLLMLLIPSFIITRISPVKAIRFE